MVINTVFPRNSLGIRFSLTNPAFPVYNYVMRKTSILIVLGLLLTGCQSSSDSHYDQTSREIERLKATTEIGDNIKIVVNSLSVSESDQFSIDSLWHYADKNVTISNYPDVYKQSGLQVGVAGDNFKARLDITKRKLKSSEESEIFLVLADGSSGVISIGKEISVPRFYYSGRWYSGVEYEFQRASRSLEVAVRKLPSDRVEIELVPVFSKFLNNQGDLKLTELSTKVIVGREQTLIIGGGDTAQENIATALFSYSKTGETKQTLITVTPYF